MQTAYKYYKIIKKYFKNKKEILIKIVLIGENTGHVYELVNKKELVFLLDIITDFYYRSVNNEDYTPTIKIEFEDDFVFTGDYYE